MKKLFLYIIILIFIPSFLLAELKIDLEVAAKSKKRIPIILYNFQTNNPQLGKELYDTIKNDLIFSDEFLIVDKNGEYGISGILTVQNNKINFKVSVKDLFLKNDNLLKSYTASTKLIRRVAHRVSADILYSITGKKGIFDYKILYVDDKTGVKQIYLIDYDGKNNKRLTYGNHIDTSPVLFKDYLLFTSFKAGNPRVYIKNLQTGIKKILILKGKMSAAPDISPDYNYITAMFGEKNNTEIGIFNINGKFLKKIASSVFDETTPVFSHDGTKIAFVSNRSGSPQVYFIDLKTNKIKRVSFGTNYSCYPSWGYNDSYIFYSGMKDGKFYIYRASLNYFHIEQIAEGEYPSPIFKDKFLLFTKLKNGFYQIFLMDIENNKIYQVTQTKSNKYYPRWYYGKY